MTEDGPNDANDRGETSAGGGFGSTIVLVTAIVAIPLILILVLICALIPAVPWWVGIIVGLVVAGTIVGLRLRNTMPVLVNDLQAGLADPTDHARFHNLAQGLALAGGVSEPKLYVIADDARNAAALARGDDSAIVVTTGLLDALDRVALEGVVAEALVRIRSGDAEAATMGAALFGNLLVGPAGGMLKPVAGFCFDRLFSADRDLSADRDAVALTRYPPGLSTALSTIQAGSPTAASSSPANDYVWLVPPTAIDESSPVAARVPLDLRIDVLGEL